MVSGVEEIWIKFFNYWNYWIYFFCKAYFMEFDGFNEKYRTRTKKFAVAIIRFYGRQKKTDEIRIIGKQLVRSATSVAANFRAATRARSNAEFFSKMCIVVEEADETVFWLEILEESNLIRQQETTEIKAEILEILKVMSKVKKNAKS